MATTAAYRLPGGAPQTTKKPAGQETYAASILQGGQDYDEIMQRYRDFVAKPDTSGGLRKGYEALANKGPNMGLIGQYQNLANSKYTPDPLSYKRTDELNTAFGNQRELAETGGYSNQDKQELRARGVSPIRSIYSSAQQGLERNKALGGGYSPNYAASSGRMAREMSDQIAGQISNVNAGIAQNVASNRLTAAPAYAQTAQNEQRDIDSINSQNVNNKYNAAALNRNTTQGALGGISNVYAENNATRLGALGGMNSGVSNNSNQMLDAIGGMRQLYGTTPALPQLYGQQAGQARQLEQQDQQLNQQGSIALMQNYQRPQPKRPPQQQRPGSFQLG